MRNVCSLILAALAVVSASAQTTADYLKLRADQHIVQPTSAQKLDGIIGPSIVEVQGVVQGWTRRDDSVELMVKREDGEDMAVLCPGPPPEWLNNGQVPARLLLHVNRGSKYDQLEANLISVAPEADIARIDEAYWKAEASRGQAQKDRNSRTTYTNPSRGDSGAFGLIGKGHIAQRYETRYTPPAGTVRAAYRNFVLERNPRLSTRVADEIAESVIGYSVQYGVDARLVMALIIAESDFQPGSTSHTGAMGLGQLMPGTASWMGVHNPYDLRDNLYGTIKLLRTHMDQYHVNRYPVGSEGYYQALSVVLAAYNAGEGAVRRHGGVPPYRETQAYVVKVIGLFRSLCSKD